MGNTALELDHAQRRQLLQRAGSMHWLHWLAVALATLLTLVAWYIANDELEGKNEELFIDESRQIVSAIYQRMQLYEHALLAAVAYIDTNGGHVSYDDWRVYASSLKIDENYPGINGIGVIFQIGSDQLDNFLAQQRIIEVRPVKALNLATSNVTD